MMQLRQRSSYLVCAITRLIVMLARAIFPSCRRSCTCMDTRAFDRTCLRAWTGREWIFPKSQLRLWNLLENLNQYKQSLNSTYILAVIPLQGSSFIFLRTVAGCNRGGYEHFSNNNSGCETPWKTFEHYGMKSGTYFSMEYEIFSTKTEGVKDCWTVSTF